jgi:hypothetical protein
MHTALSCYGMHRHAEETTMHVTSETQRVWAVFEEWRSGRVSLLAVGRTREAAERFVQEYKASVTPYRIRVESIPLLEE